MLNDLVEGGHKLHEVVAGHGGGHGEDAEHGAAPHVLLQGCHLAGDTAGTQLHPSCLRGTAGHGWTCSYSHTVTAALLSNFKPLLSGLW